VCEVDEGARGAHAIGLERGPLDPREIPDGCAISARIGRSIPNFHASLLNIQRTISLAQREDRLPAKGNLYPGHGLVWSSFFFAITMHHPSKSVSTWFCVRYILFCSSRPRPLVLVILTALASAPSVKTTRFAWRRRLCSMRSTAIIRMGSSERAGPTLAFHPGQMGTAEVAT